MKDSICIERKDGIATVTLKHPSLDLEDIQQLRKAAQGFNQDRALRVIILKGKKDHFCMGLHENILNTQTAIPPKTKENHHLLQQTCLLWRDLPVPVLLAIEGKCHGAGLQLALCGDIRIADSSASFSLTEDSGELLPMGLSSITQDLIRIDILKKLAMTGEIIDADTADTIGVITELNSSPLDRALELASLLLTKSPDSLAAGKQLYQRTRNTDDAETLLWERKLQSKLFLRWNMIAASSRNLSSNPLAYKNRKVG